MAAKTLMESIAEDEAKLSNPETLTEDNENGNEPEKPSGDQSETERDSATERKDQQDGDGTSASGRGRSKRGVRGSSGVEPQDAGNAPREDGEASSLDGSGTRKDANTSRKDAQASGTDDGRGSDAVDDKPPATGDHAAWAKLRREKRELEAQLKTAKGQPPAAQEKSPEVAKKADGKPAEDAEPDKAKDPQAWRDWKDRQRDAELAELRNFRDSQTKQQEETKVYTQAIGEYNQIRDDYIKVNPDFIPAFNHGFESYAKSIKMVRPDLTNPQITAWVDKELLKFAGECVGKGLNPAEEIYDMAIERFGYVPKSAAEVAKDESDEPEAESEGTKLPVGVRQKETPRPNLKAIADTRKRAASPLIGGGQSGKGALTKEAAANMTLGEMIDLQPKDWEELERMGAG